MNWHKLALLAVTSFLVGVIVCFAYMITTGMFTPFESTILSKSWATNENADANYTVGRETVVRKQNIYLCGDVENLESETDVAALIGMNKSELKNMFAEEDGWQVQFLSPQELVLARSINDFCQEHSRYRHLGIYQNKLAVFKGPIVINTFLMHVVLSVDIKDLPMNWQDLLNQAMKYYSLDVETQKEIKQQLEFSDEKALYAVLENIDEIN